MPTINEATGVDMSGYTPASSSGLPASSPSNEMQPGFNTMIRCPLPPIFQATPDSLRQFYIDGKVPQNRILSPATIVTNNGGSGTTVENATIFEGGTGSFTPSNPTVARNASVTTGVLGPNASFVTSLTAISRSFQLLNVTSTMAARVTLYGTAQAQTNDLSRGIDQPPAAGSTQGVITDVILDTAPYSWNFQNRIGCNGDIPQQPEVYITITNLSAAAVPLSVTLQFVSLEA